MINFCEAVNQLAKGKTIVSFIGNKYKAEDIAPIQHGPNWVIISNKSEMLKVERDNMWEVEG